MLTPGILILIALAYMALLFVIAWAGDRQRIARDHVHIQSLIFALSMAVYCTSWTFFGAVGTAATTGWGFLPIYLGPILMMLLGFDVLRRVAATSHEQRITSIADYIAYRYGRSHTIAVLVTLAAVVGSVPYIALQLKGIVIAIDVVAENSGSRPQVPGGVALWMALALALFAMLFGTRNMDASEHHRGLMWAIAFESIIKLAAFLAIGMFVIYSLNNGLGDIARQIREQAELQDLFSAWKMPDGFVVQTLLAMTAIVCLPRQFHVAIVEYRHPRELKVARWLFPMYLLIFAFLVVPIAVAGIGQFGDQGVNPDTYVLALPLAAGNEFLTVLAFIGGFSAATSMVIVATVALAIMVSNDIVMPLLLRSGLVRQRERQDLSQTLLRVRRMSILIITLMAYLYFQVIQGGVPLAAIGLLSFSAAAQFAPLILIGLYWKGASRAGALAGLSVGIFCWLWFLMIPSMQPGVPVMQATAGLDFNQGVSISLLLNCIVLIAISFIAPDRPTPVSSGPERSTGGMVTLGDLESTIGRFLGTDATREALCLHLDTDHFEPDALATPTVVQFGERLLGGSIGSASARTVLSTALHNRGLGPEDVLELLDRTSQAVQFNRELLESTLDNMSQGVAVIDANLNLVGWNRRYLELMEYPEGLVRLGQPIEELIEHNAERGLLGSGNSATEVRKRLAHLREGSPYRFERTWLNGKVIEIQGNPLPGEGYVTTYSDITHFKNIERKLQQVNENLENLILERTQELRSAMREVEQARTAAEEANRGKTRFLAAASHDLLQPMNAARLFISILRQQSENQGDETARLVMRADRSLTAAEELLTALLDISKFDSGTYTVERSNFALDELFEQLRRRFKGLAANQGLELRVRPGSFRVNSDRNLLYRVLQNYLANALRYTKSGGVLLAARKTRGGIRIGVWDTGVGIPEAEREAIFREFHRLQLPADVVDSENNAQQDRGLGLGLAICERIAALLDHPMDVRSSPGKGSCFSVTVPFATSTEAEDDVMSSSRGGLNVAHASGIHGLNVLCIDNEADILEGMDMLLSRWGCQTRLAADSEQALKIAREGMVPDIVLADFHLGEGPDGLQSIELIEQELGTKLQAIVITADRSNERIVQIQASGRGYLPKPIKPAALRALISNLLS